MSKADRVRVFCDFLKDEGYRPEVDEDGDIVFKSEGNTYLIILEENDEEYFRLVFPTFWSIESSEERKKVERAALKATADTKVAKVFPVRDDTWAAVELFASSLDDIKSVFSRSMSALQVAVGAFVEEMTE